LFLLLSFIYIFLIIYFAFSAFSSVPEDCQITYPLFFAALTEIS